MPSTPLLRACPARLCATRPTLRALPALPARSAQLCFNYVTFYPVDAMPALDVCIADTRKNISRCATATALASAARANLSDAAQLQVA